MPQKIRRVQRPQQGTQPSPPEAARHERREARDRARPQHPAAPEVMVRAQTQLRVPEAVEAFAAASDPGLYERQVLLRGAYHPRYLQKRLVGRHQDRREERILDQEGVSLVDLCLVAAGALYELDEPQVACVLRVGGTLGGIVDVVEVLPLVGGQVADLNGFEGLVPAG